ncbi:MAG TPA: GtrA family protein [Baekduia sp.]|uniref:GtrA family protein n=1 Tax=Baekduia sp. TaxID=2600305 RepID=UPI002C1143B5|nr:GtrA family protein [Baekduia sp.]HMJ35880.1 GtrA family protein [Baekduia sp.]
MSALAPTRVPRVPIGQLVRFGAVGASNTAITLGAYAALVAVGTPAVVAAVTAWALGALNGYRLNRRWTFRSAVRGSRPAARYAAVQALAAGADAAGIAVLVGHDHLPRVGGQIAILPVVTLATFLICRRWVFGPGRPA